MPPAQPHIVARHGGRPGSEARSLGLGAQCCFAEGGMLSKFLSLPAPELVINECPNNAEAEMKEYVELGAQCLEHTRHSTK